MLDPEKRRGHVLSVESGMWNQQRRTHFYFTSELHDTFTAVLQYSVENTPVNREVHGVELCQDGDGHSCHTELQNPSSGCTSVQWVGTFQTNRGRVLVRSQSLLSFKTALQDMHLSGDFTITLILKQVTWLLFYTTNQPLTAQGSNKTSSYNWTDLHFSGER